MSKSLLGSSRLLCSLIISLLTAMFLSLLPERVFAACQIGGSTDNGTGAQIAFQVYRDVNNNGILDDGEQDVSGQPLVVGERVFFSFTVFPSSGTCALSGGVMRVVSPNGVTNVVTPATGIPLMCDGGPGECPLNSTNGSIRSVPVPYIVNINDTNKLANVECPDGFLESQAQYRNGTQFTPTATFPVNNDSPNCNKVVVPCIDVTKLIACDLGNECGPYSSIATGVTSVISGDPGFCYSIVITNCGTTELLIDSVIDTQFGNITGLFTNSTGAIGSILLPAGAVSQPVYTNAFRPLGTTINQVTVNAHESAIGSNLMVQSQATSVVFKVDIDCTKGVSSPDNIENPIVPDHATIPAGGSHLVVWSITVTNKGTWPLTNVQISDPLLTCAGGFPAPFNLAVGAKRTFLCTNSSVSCTDIQNCLQNTAAVSGDADSRGGTICLNGGNGNPRAEAECFASLCCTGGVEATITKLIACLQPGPSCPDLSSGAYGKSATGAVNRATDECATFCYAIIVSNSNRSVETLANISVTDAFVGGGDNLPDLSGCVWPDLAPGQSATCTAITATHCVDTTDKATLIGFGRIGNSFTGNVVTQNDIAAAHVIPISLRCEVLANGQDNLAITLPPNTTTNVDFSVVIHNTGSLALQNIVATGSGACDATVNVAFLDVGESITQDLCTVTSSTCPPSSSLSQTVDVTGEASSSDTDVCVLLTNGVPVSASASCQNTVPINCANPGCRTTGGGKQPTPDTCPEVRYVTHGGQVGAPFGQAGAPSCASNTGYNNPCIRGEYQHVRHIKGGLRGTFHAASNGNVHQFDSLACACLPCETFRPSTPSWPTSHLSCHPQDRTYTGDGIVEDGLCNRGDRVCGPEPRKAPANKICFSGVADYTTSNGRKAPQSVVFRVDLEDRSEPGGAHPKGGTPPPDRYRMRMWFIGANAADTAPIKALREAVACKNAHDEVVAGTLPCEQRINNSTQVPEPDIDDGGDLDRGNRQIHPNTGATCQ